jgi:hypothetical protein
MRAVWCLGASVLLAGAATLYAQTAKPIGTVALADATVADPAGAVIPASSGRAELTNGSTVTAKDHTAPVKLERGGEIRVCQTSGLHVSEAADDSLLLALDRGAMEIHMKARAGDVVLTPDLRFTMGGPGELELEMRVTPSGDTCVDNKGHRAPLLKIADTFGEASYELKPGQHVTFEHGSLREVVDHETVPCGCPPTEKKVSLADAVLANGGKPVTPEQAAAAHPFPAAVSEGLASPAPPEAEAPGVTHVQVATTLAVDPNAPAPAAEAVQDAGLAAPIAAAPPAKKLAGGPFGAIGRFFKRLFVR